MVLKSKLCLRVEEVYLHEQSDVSQLLDQLFNLKVVFYSLLTFIEQTFELIGDRFLVLKFIEATRVTKDVRNEELEVLHGRNLYGMM